MLLVPDQRLVTRTSLTAALPRVRVPNAVIDCTLPALLIVSIASGWVASLLGLTEFGLHKYSSMALLLVAALHVSRYWRMVLSHFRRWRVTPVRTTRQAYARQRMLAPAPPVQIVDAQTARVLADWLQMHPDVQISIHLAHRGDNVLEYPSRTDSIA